MPASWPKLGAAGPPASGGLTARRVVHNLLAMQPIGYGNLTPARLDATFAALADPTRRAILARLRRGEATVLDLAAPFAMSVPAVSKHLKVLERAGLITRGRDAQRRPCRIQAAPLKAAAAWIGGYRRFWEESLDRLDAYLVEVTEDEHGRPR